MKLCPVGAGGALRLIHGEHGGTELTEVHRFRDPAEATAVLQLRVGDPAAIDFYTSRGRLHGGTRAAVLDELYAAWHTDSAAGRTAIMISDSTEIARELSSRAQTDRRAAGLAETGGVRLHDDTRAGLGDRVVTRHNARRLAVLGGADYVKNGDLWDVTRRFDDGSLTVRHARHGGQITLPAGKAFPQVGSGRRLANCRGCRAVFGHQNLSGLGHFLGESTRCRRHPMPRPIHPQTVVRRRW